jgi:DNA-binding NtrC family response regulator
MSGKHYDRMSKEALINELIEAERQLHIVGAEEAPDRVPVTGGGAETKSNPVGRFVPAGEPIVPLAEVERGHILRAYEETAHNKLRTAKLLRIGLNTLRRKLASYGVD